MKLNRTYSTQTVEGQFVVPDYSTHNALKIRQATL